MFIWHKVYCYHQADSCWLSSQCDRPASISLSCMVYPLDLCDANHQPCVHVLYVHHNIWQLPYPRVWKRHILQVWGSEVATTSIDFLYKWARVIPHGDTWDVVIQDNLPSVAAATTSWEQSHPQNLLCCTWGQRTLQGRQTHPKTSSSSLAQTTWRSKDTKVVWNVLTPSVYTSNIRSWIKRTRWPT